MSQANMADGGPVFRVNVEIPRALTTDEQTVPAARCRAPL